MLFPTLESARVDLPMLLLLTAAFSSGWMTGLAWFVQAVHYPLMRSVPDDRWAEFHARHVTLTTRVVAPPMLLELLTAIGLLVFPPAVPGWTLWAQAGLVAMTFALTFLQVVPLHNALSKRPPGPGEIDRLVRANLPRTFAWTARFALVLGMLMWA